MAALNQLREENRRLQIENRQLKKDNKLFREYIDEYLTNENEELLDQFKQYADHHQKYAYYQNKQFEQVLDIIETNTDGESNYVNWNELLEKVRKHFKVTNSQL